MSSLELKPHHFEAKEVSDDSLVCGACRLGVLVGQRAPCQPSLVGQ